MNYHGSWASCRQPQISCAVKQLVHMSVRHWKHNRCCKPPHSSKQRSKLPKRMNNGPDPTWSKRSLKNKLKNVTLLESCKKISRSRLEYAQKSLPFWSEVLLVNPPGRKWLEWQNSKTTSSSKIRCLYKEISLLWGMLPSSPDYSEQVTLKYCYHFPFCLHLFLSSSLYGAVHSVDALSCLR